MDYSKLAYTHHRAKAQAYGAAGFTAKARAHAERARHHRAAFGASRADLYGHGDHDARFVDADLTSGDANGWSLDPDKMRKGFAKVYGEAHGAYLRKSAERAADFAENRFGRKK